MILVARDQQESMNVAVRIQSASRDLAPDIDGARVHQLQRGTRRDERIQVDDRPILPQESMCGFLVAKTFIERERITDDLALCINGLRDTARIAVDGPEIRDLPNLCPDCC